MKAFFRGQLLALLLAGLVSSASMAQELTDVEFYGYKVTHHMGAIVQHLDEFGFNTFDHPPMPDHRFFGFFTDLSTAPEAAESARDRGQSELVAPWPTSVSAAASVHRACLARGEGRP